MRKITAIEPQKKNSQRVNVYLDGDFAFGLARITAAWLRNGEELSEEKIAKLLDEDAKENAYKKALHFLSYRPRSSQEVRQNLIKRGCNEALVEAVIIQLQNAGLVDDASFGQAWVENRSTFRPRSKSVLRMELRKKGLDDAVIRSTLEDSVNEESLAWEAARKQAHRYVKMDWPTFRQKLGGFLARRGFSYSVFAPVVSKVWKEIQMADTRSTSVNNKE